MTRALHLRPRRTGRQRGAVLVGALLFLMLLTVLGTTGVVSTTLQERMASNARNRDLAFQATEHALKDANAWLQTQTKATMRDYISADGVDLIAGDGIRANGESHPNDTDYWRNTFNWNSADLLTPVGTSLGAIADQPKYVIERLPPVADCDLAKPGNQPCDHYRVTARGLGGSAESVVILQTLYEFP